ncbi:hypothetical protein HPB47_018517 [Ixodes persulcatus]|uniref:Uncharacterized protein n=1 Tax=Ixodes persulcatus TaxID=34615 RepID=A0AC60QKI4_IXOPE|nr:hypothetical protein HPB47_018517 [Ixodes persulcatus]
MLGVAPSVLLAKLADSDNTSSSDDDDEGRVYEAKFAELFDAPCTVPKVKAYVSIVRTYSDKALMMYSRKGFKQQLLVYASFQLKFENWLTDQKPLGSMATLTAITDTDGCAHTPLASDQSELVPIRVKACRSSFPRQRCVGKLFLAITARVLLRNHPEIVTPRPVLLWLLHLVGLWPPLGHLSFLSEVVSFAVNRLKVGPLVELVVVEPLVQRRGCCRDGGGAIQKGDSCRGRKGGQWRGEQQGGEAERVPLREWVKQGIELPLTQNQLERG